MGPQVVNSKGPPQLLPSEPVKAAGWGAVATEAGSCLCSRRPPLRHSPGAVKKVTQPESAFEATPARAPEPNLKKTK